MIIVTTYNRYCTLVGLKLFYFDICLTYSVDRLMVQQITLPSWQGYLIHIGRPILNLST